MTPDEFEAEVERDRAWRGTVEALPPRLSTSPTFRLPPRAWMDKWAEEHAEEYEAAFWPDPTYAAAIDQIIKHAACVCADCEEARSTIGVVPRAQMDRAEFDKWADTLDYRKASWSIWLGYGSPPRMPYGTKSGMPIDTPAFLEARAAAVKAAVLKGLLCSVETFVRRWRAYDSTGYPKLIGPGWRMRILAAWREANP